MGLVNPWRPFDEFDRFFEQFPRKFMASFDPQRYSVPIDLKETKEQYVLSAEVPGVKKEDIKISIKEGVMTISGEVKAEKTSEDEQMHYRERSYGSFSRSVRLPERVNTSAIEAKHENGVITITIPKLDPEKDETINVELK